MASLLDMLRKTNPDISLADARKAMGIPDDSSGTPQFDALGNIVPSKEDPNITPTAGSAPQQASPLQAEVPATPQIYNEDYEKQLEDELPAKKEQDEQDSEDRVTKQDAADAGEAANAEANQTGAVKAKTKPLSANSNANAQQSTNVPTIPQEESLPKNLGQATEATRANLKAAQDEAARYQQAALWGKIGAQIGGGISGASPRVVEENSKLFDALGQAGNLSQQQLVDRISMEKQDPNSQQSVATRDFLQKQFGVKLPEGISAADIDKSFMSPTLKAFEAKQAQAARAAIVKEQLESREGIASENRAARSESARQANMMAELKRQELGQQKQQANDLKTNLDIDHRTDKLVAKAQENVASGRSAFGVAARNLQGVQNAEALLNGQDVNTLDSREVYETAKVLDRILSQGNPSISGSAKLTPETAASTLSRWKEYITNERQSAHAGSFLNRTKQTLAREKGQAKDQINSTITSMFAGSRDLYENPRSQQRLMDVLESKGIDPSSLVFNKGKISQKSSDSEAKSASNKIHVTNGKEVLEIDPKDLDSAKKDGYQQVDQ